MRRLILAVAIAGTAACAPVNSASDPICKHAAAERLGLQLAETQLGAILDPLKREAAAAALRVARVALDQRCPY